jgi:excisionase family DNA binding protein
MESLLKVEEVMEVLKISRTTAYALIKSGALKSRRIGRLVRVSSQDLGRFIAGRPRKAGK